MTITPDQVRHNGMTENLGTDVVAVDAQGNVLGRASTRESAERASPDAAAFFTGKDFESAPTAATPAPASADHNDAFDKILAQVDPAVLKDYLPAEPPAVGDGVALTSAKHPMLGGPVNENADLNPASLETVELEVPDEPSNPNDLSTELAEAKAQIAKMDPDGDGKIGGAPKGGNRQRKPKA